MTFDQETHPRVEFARNALKVVVAQVRFPVSYRLEQAGVLADLQQALSVAYPIGLPRGEEVTIAIGPGGATMNQGRPGPAQFADVSRTRTITIGSDMASFETTAYEDWPTFRAAFGDLLALLEAHVQPAQVDRLGLRFVDELPGDGARTITDWGRLVTADLLGSESGPARDVRAVRTLQLVSLDMGGETINLRHGYTRNPGDAGPASVYLIDTDASAQNVAFDIPDLLARADRYHDWAWKLFIRSLTDEAKAVLGEAAR